MSLTYFHKSVGKLLFIFSLFGIWISLAKAESNPKYERAFDNYFRENQENWLKEDLELLNPAPKLDHHHGWRLRRQNQNGEINLSIFQRPDPDGDANHLFYYWNDSVIDIPLDVAATLFSAWIDLSGNWTKELVEAKQVYENLNQKTYVWNQHFDPHIVGVKTRDLVAAFAVRELDAGILNRKAILISGRSVPLSIYPSEERSNSPQINWHGAYLLSEDTDPQKTRVRKLDRENQGGFFPACLMNVLMPKFLDEEVLKATDYIHRSRLELIDRHTRNSEPKTSK